MAGLFTVRVFARKLLRSNRRRNIFHIFDDQPGIRTQGFATNKTTYYLLDHGDYVHFMIHFIKFFTKISDIHYTVSIFYENPLLPIAMNSKILDCFKINIKNTPITILIWKTINILTFIIFFFFVHIWSCHIENNIYNMASSKIYWKLSWKVSQKICRSDDEWCKKLGQ